MPPRAVGLAGSEGQPKAAGRGRGIAFTGSGAYPKTPSQAVPLAPEVVRALALAPEAAPELAYIASSAGYPVLAARSSSSAATAGGPQQPPGEVSATGPEVSHRISGVAAAPQVKRPPRPAPGSTTSGTPGIVAATGRRPQRRAGSRKTSRSPAPHTPHDSPKCNGTAAGAVAKPAADHTKTDLTPEEVISAAVEGSCLEEITQLIYRHRGLQSIQSPTSVDFGELVSLRVLSLSHNKLASIRPVADLPSLVELNVNCNQIQDLSPAFQCEGLEVLLAANNCVSNISELELQRLRHLSLFSNALPDLGALLPVLAALPQLQRLDLVGNPCCKDPSQRYGILRALPQLSELDGDPLTTVDKQLAEEFFVCAREVGFQEQFSGAARPRTAPAAVSSKSGAHRQPSCSPSPSPKHGRNRSRARSPSVAESPPRTPGGSRRPSSGASDAELLPPDMVVGDAMESIRRYTSYLEALRLRVQTVQVDSENLRRQIHQLREREPAMGVATLQERRQRLEAENRSMHARVVENQQLREALVRKQMDIAEKRRAAGLPEELPSRPGTARPGSRGGAASAAAAAEAVLGMSESLTSGQGLRKRQADTQADLRFRNHLLRREIDRVQRSVGQLRLDACSAAIGKDFGATDGDDARGQSPKTRRPATAMVRGSAGASAAAHASAPSDGSQDLESVLWWNEQNLQQLTGRLREGEAAMGLKRPMTTGHLRERRQASNALLSAEIADSKH